MKGRLSPGHFGRISCGKDLPPAVKYCRGKELVYGKAGAGGEWSAGVGKASHGGVFDIGVEAGLAAYVPGLDRIALALGLHAQEYAAARDALPDIVQLHE